MLSLNNMVAPAYYELKKQRLRKIYAKLMQINPKLETPEYVYLEIGVLTEGEMFGHGHKGHSAKRKFRAIFKSAKRVTVLRLIDDSFNRATLNYE